MSFLIPLLFLWFFLFPIYKDRVPSFGCFDDCFNFMGGYFLNAGKHLYSEIFYNHQPILAYLSAFIQKLGSPESMYALVWQHRLMVIAWSIVWDVILVLRFGWVGLGFSFLYETTKGFLFGERFLAEALIVYPLVYLAGLVWEGWKKKLKGLELVFAGIAAWFIIFSREPYVPLGLFLFGIILWENRKNVHGALGIFFVLSLLTIFTYDLRDYFFNVVTVNTSLAATGNIFQSFVYPFLIFFGGNWNLFRQIEVGLAILFWLALLFDSRNWKTKIPGIALIFFILGLANIRTVEPGTIYYAAFHHLLGFGVFIFITLLVLQQSKQIPGINKKNSGNLLRLGFILLTAFAILNPQSYLYDRVDRNAEFTQNYGQYYVPGEVVRLLSQSSDTLFLDGLDDLIYWQAKRYSPYRYSWYTSVMHEFDVYTDARINMFKENPPDFYYGKCSDDRLESVLPDTVLNEYLRFYWQERPTCLYVRKQMYSRVPKDRLEAVERQFEYSVR